MKIFQPMKSSLTIVSSDTKDNIYMVLNIGKSQHTGMDTHTHVHTHTHTHIYFIQFFAHYYIHTGRAWSILRSLVVVLGLLCVLLLTGIIVLLTKKTGDKTTMLPTNGGQSKTHELIIR